MYRLLFLISTLLSLSSAKADTTLTPPPILDSTAMKKSIDPCNDFYQFSCGGWIDSTVLPADKSALYRQWSTLDDIADQTLAQLLQDFAAGKSKVQVRYGRELGDAFSACMNSTTESSLSAIEKRVAKISGIKDAATLSRTVGELQGEGIDALFGFYPMSDVNDAGTVTAYFDQGGMSLDRDYYFPKDRSARKILRAYKAHVRSIFRIVGLSRMEARRAERSVLEIETALANRALTIEDRRDPQKTNNPMTLAEIKNHAPGLDVDAFLAAVGISNQKNFIVAEPLFLKEMANLAANPKMLPAIKSYLIFHTVSAVATAAGGTLAAEVFDFDGRVLHGKKENDPRWKVCTHLVSSQMRDALSEAYIAVKDGTGPRAKTNEIIDLVKSIFKDNLASLTWMDDSTRAAAADKLDKIARKVGWPDQLKDFEGLVVTSTDAVENDFAASHFASARAIKQVGGPVDRGAWDMPPWEANAYYDPSMNEFVFPLGELLPPVLDMNASDGANFGALGATVGHELTHGFDDEGHQYDAQGNLRNWWTPAVEKQFNEKTACYAAQADKYEVLPGLFVKGKQTLGENLADQGGTKLAWLAYRRLADKRAPAPAFDGFNEDQQFFISYAQSWCGKMRPEALRTQVLTNPHPPTDFRVNEVVMNMPQFSQAFGCKAGTKMAPVDRCSLW